MNTITVPITLRLLHLPIYLNIKSKQCLLAEKQRVTSSYYISSVSWMCSIFFNLNNKVSELSKPLYMKQLKYSLSKPTDIQDLEKKKEH